MFNSYPEKLALNIDDSFMADWDHLHAIRDDIKKEIENARKEKIIGASLDSKVTLYATGAAYDILDKFRDRLAAILIASDVELINGEGGNYKGEEGIGVTVEHASGCKCERCWTYSPSVGSNPDYADLCARCAAIISAQ